MPLTIFQYSESARSSSARAGLGDGVRPDHVRAGDESCGPRTARALKAQTRAHTLVPAFTTPSPGRHTASAHTASREGRLAASGTSHPQGQGENVYEKRARPHCSLFVRPTRGCSRDGEEQLDDYYGRWQHVRPAARLRLDAGAWFGVRIHGAIQRCRFRCRYRRDLEPPGRLRCVRRTALA